MTKLDDNRPPPPRFHARECGACGHVWIARDSICPQCDGVAKSGGDEMTKKVVDDSDLRKGMG